MKISDPRESGKAGSLEAPAPGAAPDPSDNAAPHRPLARSASAMGPAGFADSVNRIFKRLSLSSTTPTQARRETHAAATPAGRGSDAVPSPTNGVFGVQPLPPRPARFVPPVLGFAEMDHYQDLAHILAHAPASAALESYATENFNPEPVHFVQAFREVLQADDVQGQVALFARKRVDFGPDGVEYLNVGYVDWQALDVAHSAAVHAGEAALIANDRVRDLMAQADAAAHSNAGHAPPDAAQLDAATREAEAARAASSASDRDFASRLSKVYAEAESMINLMSLKGFQKAVGWLGAEDRAAALAATKKIEEGNGD